MECVNNLEAPSCHNKMCWRDWRR